MPIHCLSTIFAQTLDNRKRIQTIQQLGLHRHAGQEDNLHDKAINSTQQLQALRLCISFMMAFLLN